MRPMMWRPFVKRWWYAASRCHCQLGFVNPYARPPRCGSFSNSVTWWPRLERSYAAVRPVTPPPITVIRKLRVDVFGEASPPPIIATFMLMIVSRTLRKNARHDDGQAERFTCRCPVGTIHRRPDVIEPAPRGNALDITGQRALSAGMRIGTQCLVKTRRQSAYCHR